MWEVAGAGEHRASGGTRGPCELVVNLCWPRLGSREPPACGGQLCATQHPCFQA